MLMKTLSRYLTGTSLILFCLNKLITDQGYEIINKHKNCRLVFVRDKNLVRCFNLNEDNGDVNDVLTIRKSENSNTHYITGCGGFLTTKEKDPGIIVTRTTSELNHWKIESSKNNTYKISMEKGGEEMCLHFTGTYDPKGEGFYMNLKPCQKNEKRQMFKFEKTDSKERCHWTPDSSKKRKNTDRKDEPMESQSDDISSLEKKSNKDKKNREKDSGYDEISSEDDITGSDSVFESSETINKPKNRKKPSQNLSSSGKNVLPACPMNKPIS